MSFAKSNYEPVLGKVRCEPITYRNYWDVDIGTPSDTINPVRNCIGGSVRGFCSQNELTVLHCSLIYKCWINLFACETVLRVPVFQLSDELSFIQKSRVIIFFMNTKSFISDADGILQIYRLHGIEVLKWLIYFTLRYLHALRWNVKYEFILL